MSSLLTTLPAKERRGSRARCVMLTHGSQQQVADRLNALVAPHAAVQPGRHVWAPKGFLDAAEARLGESPAFLSAQDRETVSNWWLAVRSARANTPNWDIVSQATIEGREGLILVEAKAHGEELEKEEAGKRPRPAASANSRKNHEQIGTCIDEANEALRKATGLDWRLSRNSCYQMSNRFAWAWKLADMQVPVVLVYLGFLKAEEMRDRGTVFTREEDWDGLVKSHSAALFPEQVWGRAWDLKNGTRLIPLIRSLEWPLRDMSGEAEA